MIAESPVELNLSGNPEIRQAEQSGIDSRQRANHSETMKMYVGNLPFDTSEDDLRNVFGEFGAVTDVHIPIDRESNRPRGFAFVTMDSQEAMVNAIKDLDGQELNGRNMRVNEAQPREERGGGGGGGGDRRGGGGDRRGGGGGDRRGGGGGNRGGGGGGGRW